MLEKSCSRYHLTRPRRTARIPTRTSTAAFARIPRWSALLSSRTAASACGAIRSLRYASAALRSRRDSFGGGWRGHAPRLPREPRRVRDSAGNVRARRVVGDHRSGVGRARRELRVGAGGVRNVPRVRRLARGGASALRHLASPRAGLSNARGRPHRPGDDTYRADAGKGRDRSAGSATRGRAPFPASPRYVRAAYPVGSSHRHS